MNPRILVSQTKRFSDDLRPGSKFFREITVDGKNDVLNKIVVC